MANTINNGIAQSLAYYPTTGTDIDDTGANLKWDPATNQVILSGRIQINKNVASATDTSLSLIHYGSTFAPIYIGRSLGNATNPAKVTSGYTLGGINFTGRADTTFNTGAYINAVVDGLVNNNSMPSKIVFGTHNGNALATRAEISKLGELKVNIIKDYNGGILTLNPATKLDLGVASKISIGGGSAGQVLSFNSNGVLEWITITSTGTVSDSTIRNAINAGTGIAFNKATGFITNTITSTDLLTEGTNRLYFTQDRARNSIRGGEGIQYTLGNIDSQNGIIILKPANYVELGGIRGEVGSSIVLGHGVRPPPATQVVTIGANAGEGGQGNYTVAIGSGAGLANQKEGAVAIGTRSGQGAQGHSAVAIGHNAGNSGQSTRAVAVGSSAGLVAQGESAVAIGILAGGSIQSAYAIAIGMEAGYRQQGNQAVAVGFNAGLNEQGNQAVAIGAGAGQGLDVSALYISGAYYQGAPVPSVITLVVGTTSNIIPGMIITGTGFTSGQTVVSVIDGSILQISAPANSNPRNALLRFTGQPGWCRQGEYAVAIGSNAGGSSQGNNAVAIGHNAGNLSQSPNSIILNATGQALNNQTTGLFIKPIRNGGTTKSLYYDTDTGEVSYSEEIPVVKETPPTTATSSGITGQIAYDSNYVYICTATNTWKRSALSSW
jgi:hypothetical protein